MTTRTRLALAMAAAIVVIAAGIFVVRERSPRAVRIAGRTLGPGGSPLSGVRVTLEVSPGESGGISWHREGRHLDSGAGAVPVPELDGLLEREPSNPDFSECGRHRQQAGILGEDRLDGFSRIQLKAASFTEQRESHGVVELGVGGDDSFHRRMPHAGWHLAVEMPELLAHVGRGVQQKPAFAICADRGGRLGTWMGP